MSTEILTIDEVTSAQSDKFVTHNTGLRQLEGQTIRVLSRTNAGPPGSPTNGDTYIVDVVTGTWASASLLDIAHYYGSAWSFYTPVQGMRLHVNDENKVVLFDGVDWDSELLVSSAALTQGSVVFVDSAGNLTEDNANLFWDDTNNRLGVGTVSPSVTLDIVGEALFTLTDNTANAFDIVEGANEYFSIDTTDSSELMTFGNATTNPDFIFTGSGILSVIDGSAGGVSASANADSIVVESSANAGISILSANTGYSNIFFGDGDDSLRALVQYNNSADELVMGGQNAGVEVVVLSGASTEALRVDSSQNVGIGQSTATARLHVKSSVATQLKIERASVGVGVFGIDNVVGTADMTLSPETNNSGVVLQYRTSGGTLTDGVTLDPSGNVGIGTPLAFSATAATLDARDNANSDVLVSSFGNDDSTTGTSQSVSIGFGLTRDSGAYKPTAGMITTGRTTGWTASDANINAFMSFSIIEANAVTEKFRVDSTGVGIGTGSGVDAILHVEHSSGPVFKLERTGFSPYGKFEVDGTGLRFGTAGAAGPIKFLVNDTVSLSLSTTGQFSTGGEEAPDVDAGGVCVNHGASDGNALTFKNSDVAHGVTAVAETDTYTMLSKFSATDGGVEFTGLTQGPTGVKVRSIVTSVVTGDTTQGALALDARLKSGTSVTAMGNGDNMITVQNAGSVKAVVKGNGEIVTQAGVEVASAVTCKSQSDFTIASGGLVGGDATNGLNLKGDGSTNDLRILNTSSQNVLTVLTGTRDITLDGGGVYLNGGTDLLDTYEEGTWTPELWDSTLATDPTPPTYSVQVGTYTRVGDLVHVQGYMVVSALGGLTTSEAAVIGGLPFASSSVSNNKAGFAVGNAESLAITAGNSVAGLIDPNTSYVRLKLWDSTAGASNLLISEYSAGGELSFSATYKV